MRNFVAIDVETASRSPPRICALAAVRIEDGHESAVFQSRVAVAGPVRFSRIHRLTASDLEGAPPWPAVWRAFTHFLASTRRLFAFRASFDRGALLSMCGLYGLSMPRLRFECAAELASRRLGYDLSLKAALTALGVPFPGRPHDPLADARAAAALVLACQDQHE